MTRRNDTLLRPAVQIFWSKGMDCYIAVVPSIRDLTETGYTITEAARNIDLAITRWAAENLSQAS